jgi:hypothetical protein
MAKAVKSPKASKKSKASDLATLRPLTVEEILGKKTTAAEDHGVGGAFAAWVKDAAARRAKIKKAKAKKATAKKAAKTTPAPAPIPNVSKSKVAKNIVVISDLHVGCQLGLCHPDGARLDNGGTYVPSDLQLKVWDVWTDYWKWVFNIIKDEPFDIVINGDLLDGSHHNSTHQWSHNLEDQAHHAYQLLKPYREKADQMWIIRGTPVHSGESGVDEERLAKRLACNQSKAGQYARNELWHDIDGDLIHFAHHIGTTSSSAHEVSAVNAELTALFTESGRWSHTPPSIVCRSHRHRCSEIRLPTNRTYAIAFVTAAWQLRTPFAYKVSGGRTTTPQIGGSLIRKGDQDLYTRHFVHDIGRTIE